MGKRLSYLCLRFGLGLVFLWIGIDIFRHTGDWIGYAPPDGTLGMTRDQLIKLGGFFDAAVGISLILGTFPKITAALAAFHLAMVLLLQGVNAVLIRDVGLLGAALSLFFWKNGYRRRSWWRRSWRRSSPEA
jgi:uncharacterized membrane protein YphA (DoxX/SURF4 family)